VAAPLPSGNRPRRWAWLAAEAAALALLLGVILHRGATCGPGAPLDEATARVLELRGDPGVRGVVFGGRCELCAARLEPSGEGLRVRLLWRSLSRPRRDLLVRVALVDEQGRTRIDFDYLQPSPPGGGAWQDGVNLPRHWVVGSARVAVGLGGPFTGPLTPDRGPRDPAGERVLLALPH
jgi:hypothetical protein